MKYLINFTASHAKLYKREQDDMKLIRFLPIDYKENDFNTLEQSIFNALLELLNDISDADNSSTRVIFSHFDLVLSDETKYRIVIDVYVNYGLYLYFVPEDLALHYQNCASPSSEEKLIDGMLKQAFRKVVICGSFQHHLQEIENIIRKLNAMNVTVLSPWTTKVIPETIGTDFILLEGQQPLRNERDTWTHKYRHMEQFIDADAIIICDPSGHVGKGTLFEIGFMVANNKRIIFTEKPQNLSILFPCEIGLDI